MGWVVRIFAWGLVLVGVLWMARSERSFVKQSIVADATVAGFTRANRTRLVRLRYRLKPKGSWRHSSATMLLWESLKRGDKVSIRIHKVSGEVKLNKAGNLYVITFLCLGFLLVAGAIYGILKLRQGVSER